MQTPPRRSGVDRRWFWKRVARALLGRSGRITGGRRPRVRRTLPWMALGAAAMLAVDGWTAVADAIGSGSGPARDQGCLSTPSVDARAATCKRHWSSSHHDRP